MRHLITISAFLCLFNVILGAHYPSDLPKCKAGDVKCIATAATDVIKKVSNSDGYPSLFLPSIDPLHVKEIRIKQGAQSPVNVELIFTDVDLFGLKGTEFTKVSGFGKDPNGKYELELKLSEILFISRYSISGRVLVLPIQGVGNCNLTLENPTFLIKFLGKSDIKNGKEYLKIDKFKFAFTTTRLRIYLGNLFNGDKALGDNTNLFLNNNWEDILNELKGNLFDAFGQVIEALLKNVFTKIPYKELFVEE